MQIQRLLYGGMIRYLRVQRGVTLRSFACDLRMTPTEVSKMERGERDIPRGWKLERMAEVLGIGKMVLVRAVGVPGPPLNEEVFPQMRGRPDFLERRG